MDVPNRLLVVVECCKEQIYKVNAHATALHCSSDHQIICDFAVLGHRRFVYQFAIHI